MMVSEFVKDMSFNVFVIIYQQKISKNIYCR